MQTEQDILNAAMGLDASGVGGTNPFEKNDGPKVDPNVYKTHPRDSKSEDHIYRAKVRVIYNPWNYNKSIVSKTEWYLQGQYETLQVTSMLDTKENRRRDPLFRASSEAFLAMDGFAERFVTKMYPGPKNAGKRSQLLDEFNEVTGRGKEAWEKKFKGTALGTAILDYAKKTFDNNTSTWCLVQILEDENKPELVGQFKLMKLPKDIQEKLRTLQYPSEVDRKNGKKPTDVMSWCLGYPLEINVQPGDDQDPVVRDRNISYATCAFSTDFEPIRKEDGTALFDDDQMEILCEFEAARKLANSKAKTKKDAAAIEEAAAKIAQGTELFQKVTELTGIALKYLRDINVLNVADIEYKPWDAETTEKVDEWIRFALMKDVTPDIPEGMENIEVNNDEMNDAPAAPSVQNPGVPF